MSLSKIGKLTSAFSSFKNNPLDLTNMATALASVGNVDNAAKYLVKINKQNGNFLGENAMAVLLSKAYRSSGINQEMAMGSINNALANSSKFSMGGMLGSLSAVGTGIATMFESIAPVIIPLIIAAVAAKAGKMAWDNFATNTAAKKKYQTSSKAYQEAASERDSVQSEYDSNKERIQELRAKANRTVDESKELSNLQSQNDLLNSQLSVKNQIADTAQKQAALDAKTALEKGSYRSGGLLNMDYDSDLEHASQLIKEIKEAQSEKAEIEANRSSYDDSYWSDYQKEERDIAKYDKDITNKKSDLSDLMTTISDTSQDFWDEQGNLVDKSTKDTADKVKKLANDYTSITGVSDIDSKMNNLFARSQFKDVKDQLLDIGKKQGSKGIETKIDEIDGLKFALDDAGISVDDFTSELMAMADPDAKNLEGIKENLKDIFGEIKDADGNSLYDFFKDKSNKDIEGYYDYFLNQGLNPQTSDYTWKKEDIENSWSLIPGGAHIENLKKGDIIFSTTQTDALLKHGAIQGHARAYASGTVTSPGVMKAYAAAGNTPGFHFQGGAATVKPAGSGNSGNSGNSGLQHAIEDNTDAVSNNSNDTSDAADKVSEALQNVIKKLNDNAMDWAEVAMDRLDRIL